MTHQSNYSDSDDKYGHCPIPKTHRRLAAAHLLWHQTLGIYHDPDAFRANLNATIEALRNVTFMLQTEKAAIAEFEEWYTSWQDRLRADTAAKWMHDARNTVVHQGELESHSTAEVRLITWRDEIVAKLTIPAETPSHLILQNLQFADFLDKSKAAANDLKDAAIAVERRWSTTGLGDREILDVLAHVYGLLSDLVLDAHTHLNRFECIPAEHNHPDFRSLYHRTGTLLCMAVGAEKRTKVFKLSNGGELGPTETALPISQLEQIAAPERYGFGMGDAVAEWEQLDPIRFAERILHHAKRMLRRDKYHRRMIFIRDGRGEWHMRALVAEDRTEKHLLMRMVAQFVEANGCDAIVEVGEMWSAPLESMAGLDLNRIQDAKGRGELLFVLVATREGISRRYMTPFTRGPFGGIRLGDTNQQNGGFPPYLQPILEVWRRQGIVVSSDGKAMRQVWEPDPLDVCFCGGPKRFAECCRPHILGGFDLLGARDEIANAMASSQFGRAEELSRAALAQYVIWVKRHTVITMNVAQDLHRKLVEIDAPALEDLIGSLQDSMDANGNSDLVVSQMRSLASIVGVPGLSVRVVALISRWLFASGKPEEAIIELDTLGDLDKIEDALALLTAVNILDLPDERQEQLLLRASAMAICEEEKWFVQCALVEHMLNLGRRDEALPIVDSIISESRSSAGQKGVPPEPLLLRWKITKNESDFQSFMEAIERRSAPAHHHFAAILIEEGKNAEAERLLGVDISAGDPIAKLLVTDARIRSGNGDTARDLFLGIDRERISQKLRYPHAVACAHLAFSCKDERIRQLAILYLRELSDSGAKHEDVDVLLKALQNKNFPESNPPE